MDLSLQPQSFADPAVSAAFSAASTELHAPLLRLRQLILDVGSELPELGGVVETLKWGEPAYHPAKPRLGTTIRINAHRRSASCYALYVPCQTRLIEIYRFHYPAEFRYDGKRALLFDATEELPLAPLRHCIVLAFTYHRSGRAAG